MPNTSLMCLYSRTCKKRTYRKQLEREKAKNLAMKAFEKEIANYNLIFAKKHTHSSKGTESSVELQKLPAGAPFLVWRESSKCWEEPFKFINIEGETVVVQLPHGRKIFRSTVIKSNNSRVSNISDM